MPKEKNWNSDTKNEKPLIFSQANTIRKVTKTLHQKTIIFHLQIYSKAKGWRMEAKIKITSKVIEKKTDNQAFLS